MHAPSDEEFLRRFERLEIPRAEWSHAAHVRMAWLYLREHSFRTALGKIRRGIQRLNASYGNATGYHETVTRAFASLIAAAIVGEVPASRSFAVFKRRHPRLFSKRRPALLDYYGPATLASSRARQRFVLPDLKPLPAIEAAAKPAGLSGVRNLGPVSAAWLEEAGIVDLEQLQRLGAVAAFRLVKRRRPAASLNLLWALDAALSGRDWRELPLARRTHLRAELARELA